jgi:anti-sigma B factor antagonist
MSAPLRITRRAVDRVTVLELSGRLVFDEGDRALKEQVTSLVAAGNTNMLIDLHDVVSIDSGGVGALVGMYLHVTRRGGQFKLLCPSPRSCEVLRITHLATVFDVFDNEEAALRSFSAPGSPGVEAGTHRRAG